MKLKTIKPKRNPAGFNCASLLSNHKGPQQATPSMTLPLRYQNQLKVERDAGRIFQGWHEHAIHFQPTYKFFEESDQYFGEHTFKGDKRRTPAWCDRILSYGKGLRQLSYSMVEARLSDHRPVIARFIADVEAVSRRKLSKACNLANDEKVNAEELLPRIFPVSKFHSLHNHEHIEHSIKHCCKTRISNDVF